MQVLEILSWEIQPLSKSWLSTVLDVPSFSLNLSPAPVTTCLSDVEAVGSVTGDPRFHVFCFLGRNPCCEGCLSPCLHRHCRKWRVSASSPHLNSRGKRRMASKVREETVPFCTTLMRTPLEYCVQIWGPYHKKDVELMEWVQRRTMSTSPIRKGSGSRACSTCPLAVRGIQYNVMPPSGFLLISSELFLGIHTKHVSDCPGEQYNPNSYLKGN